ncbi:MAG: hypothetical protein CSB49_04360 [Proteobacteria bacterium]|nr:MAG: hypothetical protein CSB49_04360 [Pseudomonadota bacterium]
MTKRLIRTLIVGALAFPLVSGAGDAEAQGKDKKDGKDSKTAAPKVTVKRGKGGKKIFRIDTGFVIEGRIQKPNAFYFLERAQINYNWLKLKKDFVPRILEATKRDPF